MSSKSKKSTSRSGPSRPVDPRRAPGAAPRKGPDMFGMALIGVSAAFVLLIVALLALNGNRGATTTTGAANNAGAGAGATPQNSAGGDAVASATAAEVVFLTQVADVPRISVQDTKALLDAHNVTIIDVRVPQNYTQEHIAGAINLPNNEYQQRLSEIPKTGNVVLYCECPNDEESAGVAKGLMNGGYTNVKILEGPAALSKWKNAGFPVGAGNS